MLAGLRYGESLPLLEIVADEPGIVGIEVEPTLFFDKLEEGVLSCCWLQEFVDPADTSLVLRYFT